MDEALLEYRHQIIEAGRKAQEEYDKNVLYLSGGSLGLSFTFIKEIIGANPLLYSHYLVFAWIAWSISILLVLLSFWLSINALRQTLNQINEGTIHTQIPGGIYSKFTKASNFFSGFFFFIGVVLMSIFVFYNLG